MTVGFPIRFYKNQTDLAVLEDDTQNEHLVPPPTQSVVANSRENISDDKLNDTTGKNANEQLRTAIVQVISTPLASEETLPSTQQELSPLIPTPPCSQPPPSDLESSDPVSRQSTLSTMGVTLSSSSLSSNDVAAEDEDSVLHRVLAVAQEATDQCRVCWVSREKSRPHATFRCPTRICSSREWQVFKSDLRFPPGAVCYFCLAPYGPPFNHARAAPGVRQSPELCEYPDVLKELVYIIYQDEVLREKVFSTLGVNAPSTLYLYKRYITKEQDEGIFGAYKVVNAYLDVRQAEGLSSHHHASR